MIYLQLLDTNLISTYMKSPGSKSSLVVGKKTPMKRTMKITALEGATAATATTMVRTLKVGVVAPARVVTTMTTNLK